MKIYKEIEDRCKEYFEARNKKIANLDKKVEKKASKSDLAKVEEKLDKVCNRRTAEFM